MQLQVPYEQQTLDYMCGPHALRMILTYFDRTTSVEKLAVLAGTTPQQGTSRRGMVQALRAFDLDVQARHGASIQDLHTLIAQGIPPIILYRDHTEEFGHYGVVVGITNSEVIFHDPWHGPNQRALYDEFLRRWYGRHKTQFTRWLVVGRPRIPS